MWDSGLWGPCRESRCIAVRRLNERYSCWLPQGWHLVHVREARWPNADEDTQGFE